MARDDRDMDVEVGRDETERRSSSHRDKSRKDSGSKRDRDGDREKDREKDREGKSRRSSKHSRDKERESGHSSSSRKRERSEERTARDHSRDRSRERELREEDDRSHKGDDDGKRRRREEGSSRSSSSRKSKHRDKDGKSGGSSGKHKSKDKDRKGDGKDKERHKDRHRSKGDKEDAEAASVDRGEPNGDGKGYSPEDENAASNGDPGSMEASLVVSEVIDGEEGEVILEPKKPAPLPKAPAEHRADNGSAEKENGAGDTSEETAKAFAAPDSIPSKEASMSAPVPMTDEQAEEAARLARIAARAEERAAERAKARAAAKAASVSTAAPPTIPAFAKAPSNGSVGSEVSTGPAAVDQVRRGDARGGKIGGIVGAGAGTGLATAVPVKPTFKTKKQREQEALQRLDEQRRARRKEQEAAAAERGTSERQRQAEEDRQRQKARELEREEARAAREKEKEMESLRDHYLGKKKVKKKIVKPSEKFSKIFQFDWDASEDTSRDANPLYSQRAQLNASFGRGYLAGIDMREQRKDSAFLTALMQKRQEEQRRAEEADHTLTAHDKAERERMRAQQMAEVAAFSREEADGLGDDPTLKGAHWSEKPLAEMSDRDWRIFREDFDIRVKGGKAPLPLRFWEEGKLPSSVMEAIRELGYEKPSPIQRQAIPIGMERRDIIGIAETGSGKTAAFGIPMIAYILSLDSSARERVAEQGPLALIMAPTRELAMQIEEECKKFCKFAGLHTVCVVGGQSIEQQAFNLRKGVEIIIGTPGRLNDCVEKHYLVLNQCHYVVLDEADRMIDMGFEDQVLAVLDAMGGTLKADDEQQAYLQELRAKEARNTKDLVRVTAMFSATMPPAVERMAKKYLRHPAIVQIGDEDTGKNRRIEQRVLWTTEAQKKTQVLEILRRYGPEDRVLVFINTKKSADILGRQLEQAGFSTVVLHGGKTQDQREDNLESFREGIYTVLVATDVASRGLDIPDVKEVINYELPSKIETYCHRIGRTGRAGKDGIATSFLTEHDEEIMFGLKEYLQSTESHVPPQLAKHSAAQAAVGARREDGTLINSKRDTVMFSKM